MVSTRRIRISNDDLPTMREDVQGIRSGRAMRRLQYQAKDRERFLLGYKFKTPCLVCGVLTDGGSRCSTHESLYQAKRNQRLDSLERKEKKRSRYNSQYKKRAKQVRDQARLVPTACHICKREILPSDRVEADHVYPELGDLSPLLPAHSVCNQRRGNKPINS